MCIRDRGYYDRDNAFYLDWAENSGDQEKTEVWLQQWVYGCLLYTSDAADERSSVDLGGRRIIKKQNRDKFSEWQIVKEYVTYTPSISVA